MDEIPDPASGLSTLLSALDSQDKPTADLTSSSLKKSLPDPVESTVKPNPDPVYSLSKQTPVPVDGQAANAAGLLLLSTENVDDSVIEDESGLDVSSNAPGDDDKSAELEVKSGLDVSVTSPGDGDVASSPKPSIQSPPHTQSKRAEEEQEDTPPFESPDKLLTTVEDKDVVLTISSPAAKNRVPLFEQSNVPWQSNTAKPVDVSTFTQELNEAAATSELHALIKVIKQRITTRFPKVGDFRSKLLEFLAHSISDKPIGPVIYPDALLTNGYITALPFIEFANLIYSKTLIFAVAALSLSTVPPKRKKKKEGVYEPFQLWGMPVPIMDDKSAYRFWVVHVNGRIGNDYMNKLQVHEGSKHYKNRDDIVNFFSKQFDELRPDESSHIQDGFTKNCETLYIAGFTSTECGSPEIIAAIQYSTSPLGAWINWLAVSSGKDTKFLTDSKSPRNFRGMGLGIFLQVLVQFKQLAKGWMPRLFLQTLLSGNAVSFYLTRGYVRAPRNLITSIPDIITDPFVDNHIHFVSDDFQRSEKTEREDFLVLHYVQGFVVTTFLDDTHPYFSLTKLRCMLYQRIQRP
jgi:hypothetical protein